MLGDKIKEWFNITQRDSMFLQDAIDDLNQLIESHEKRMELEGELEEYQILKEAIENLEKYIPGSTDGYSLSEMIDNRIAEEVKLYNQIEKLEKENNQFKEELAADHASSQEIIDDLTIDYNQACEEIEELKEDALLGRAFRKIYSEVSCGTCLYGPERNETICVCSQCDDFKYHNKGFSSVKKRTVLDLIADEVKDQTKEEG